MLNEVKIKVKTKAILEIARCNPLVKLICVKVYIYKNLGVYVLCIYMYGTLSFLYMLWLT
jgi:hypothetical protein